MEHGALCPLAALSLSTPLLDPQGRGAQTGARALFAATMQRVSSIARVRLAPRASRVVSAPTGGSGGSSIPLPAPGVFKLPPTTELWHSSETGDVSAVQVRRFML